MDEKIESYLDKIVSRLHCSDEERQEIIDEMKDHLTLLQHEYVEQGYTDEEAAQKAIENFGEQKQLAKNLQTALSPIYKLFSLVFALYALIALYKLLFERIMVRIIDYTSGNSFNRFVFTPPNSEGYFSIEALSLNSNIVPFKNIIHYITGHDYYNLNIILDNLLGNILIFLPLGIFLPLLFRKYNSFMKILVVSTIISFSVECVQILLKLGQFDIDDVILNVIGGIIGYLFVHVIKKTNLPIMRKLSQN